MNSYKWSNDTISQFHPNPPVKYKFYIAILKLNMSLNYIEFLEVILS